MSFSYSFIKYYRAVFALANSDSHRSSFTSLDDWGSQLEGFDAASRTFWLKHVPYLELLLIYDFKYNIGEVLKGKKFM